MISWLLKYSVMTSANMYNEFVRYFERMGELYKEYTKGMERINQLYTESIKNVEKTNELYRELIKTNERMTELYKDIQKINLDWLDIFWRPWLSKEQEKKDNTQTEGKTQNIRD